MRLSLQHVSKAYAGRPVVGDLTLDVEDGELVVLVGPSGSGKTTTLRLIAGLERPDGGSILIGERDVTTLPPAARDVAMVFQSYALFPHMTVFDNLAFGLAARREARAEIETAVRVAADRLGLAGLLERKPHQLSGGERQRVALGRALVRRPSVFLMDEPLSNLDAQLRVQTREEIVRLHERVGTTTVYVTHDQAEALAIGHRLGVLRDGTLEQIGEPGDVYDRPASTFVASFLGNPPMNLLPSRREGSDAVWGSVRAFVPAGTGDVVLGVRPEHVDVAGSRWSPAFTDGFDAIVELVEPLGDQSIVRLNAESVPIRARVDPRFRPAQGERVRIHVDPAHVNVFDAASGRRIG